MSALDRKLRRDLWRMKGQATAIALVVACAVAAFVGSTTTHRSLGSSLRAYYDRYRFADVFARCRRAPRALVPRLEALPGVAAVQVRVVAAATLDVPGLAEPAAASLVSLPRPGEPDLGRIYLLAGRLPESADEVLASDGFAKAHRLRPGDSFAAVLNARRRALRIAGVATSPDHIYQIRPGDLLPDDRHFAILWMEERALAAATGLDGAFNDVSLRLAPGAAEPDVLARLDDLLAPYGGLGAYGRDRHVSHRFISDEIRQLKAIAVFVPAIFLGVAAFLLNVVVSRLVGVQREQIAALKALGYSNGAVGLHFVKLVAVIVVLGAALGSALGAWFGAAMTGMYALYYHLPLFAYRFEAGVAAVAALLALGAALAGVAGAVRRAVRLPPAEAMRPEPPPTYRPTVLERLGVQKLLSMPGRIVLRNLGRRPWRALLSSVGIALAVAILVVGAFSEDALDYVLDVQFGEAQREDVTVGFAEPRPAAALRELRRFPGVLDGEPFRAVPVVLRAGHRTYRTALLGLRADARLHRVADARGRPVPVPPSGVMLTAKLGELLGVRVGDVLAVDVLEGRRPRREVVVAALVDELVGVSAYMALEALDRLAGDPGTISGAFLAADPRRTPELYAALKSTPAVAGVLLQGAAIRSFKDTAAQQILFFSGILVLFAGVIAAGVVYNAARVSLAERERELASLRVLGLTRGEISRVLLGELAVVVLAALPLGFLAGWVFAAGIASAMDSDLFRLPVIVERSTYAFAAAVVLAASAVTALAVRRRLDRLDLVAVLKTKE